MSGQGRKIRHNGILAAESTGSDNIITEGNNVRGSMVRKWDMDFEGSLDEVSFTIVLLIVI